MPSTYTLNNGIELIGTGEQSGTWGDTTNTNFELLDTALDGQVSVTLAATGSSGSPNTLPISDGASSNGRNRLVIFGDGGDLGGTAFVQLTPNDAEKIIYVRNNLSGSRSILLFQGTYSASNDYEVPAGTTAVVFFNGAGTGAVAANVFNNAFFDSLRLGSVSVDKILDEDNMASNDAAALATQQSIKAYVDSQVGTVDTLSEILANGNTSGGTNIQMTTTDELQFRDTALKISSSADGQLDIDADTEIEIVAPTVDIDASTAMTIDTAALTVTGAVDLNTSLNVDGTVTSDGLTVAGNLSVDGGTIKLDGNYPVGTGNVALGDTALSSAESGANYNIAIGSAAGDAITTGDSNVGIGLNALGATTTASENIAIGLNAMLANTTGASNVGIGTYALNANTTASGNTMAGYQAGYLVGDEIVATAIVSGVNYTIQTLGTTDFTLIGAGANTVGTTFTATGAGSGTGTASANANYNTFVGHQAGDVIVGGSKNSILGRFDGNQNTIDIRNSDNNIVLSDGDGNPRLAYVSANTELVINEQSANVDFRVESDGNTHMLFVDAGANHVNIGTSTDLGGMLNVAGQIKQQSGSSVALQLESTQADNNTGPYIYLYGNSSSPAANDITGGIVWRYNDDGGSEQSGMQINHILYDVAAASDDTGFAWYNKVGGTDRQIFTKTNSEIIVNQDSVDLDFRVESDGNTHMLFVDAGVDRVSVGGNTPNATLGVQSTDDAEPTLRLAASGANGTDSSIRFQAKNSGGTNRYADIVFDADKSTGAIKFYTDYAYGSDDEVLTLDDEGAVFNEGSADKDFRVESNAESHFLFVDAGNERLGINNSSPGVLVDVQRNSTTGFSNTSDQRAQSALTLRNGSEASGRFVGMNLIAGGGAQADWSINNVWQSNYVGKLAFKTRVGANSTDWRQILAMTASNEVVFNEDSTDIDFRVESDNQSNMLTVDAGTDCVIIGGGAAIDTVTYFSLQGIANGDAGEVKVRTNGKNAFKFRNSSNGVVGSITLDTSGTTYNTTSDRRLKTDIQPIADGTDKLMAMNPVSHKWIADPEANAVHGFIAQEMQDVIPEAVSGDPDGDEMMSMDYGRITPVLVAALQDAHNKITALEKRLAELEAN